VQCRCRATLFRNIAALRRPTHSACRRCSVRRFRTRHGKSHTSEYNIYQSARARCQNPSDPSYHRYGGRGIECRFESFEEFYDELGTKPGPDYSVDRIDNDGHYERGNVRWATHTTQRRNTSQILSINVNGETRHVWDIADETGLTRDRIHHRIRVGMCNKCIFDTTRTRMHCKHGRRDA
jgi:hypothetical protein